MRPGRQLRFSELLTARGRSTGRDYLKTFQIQALSARARSDRPASKLVRRDFGRQYHINPHNFLIVFVFEVPWIIFEAPRSSRVRNFTKKERKIKVSRGLDTLADAGGGALTVSGAPTPSRDEPRFPEVWRPRQRLVAAL